MSKINVSKISSVGKMIKNNAQYGFTLIELMVVVGMVGIVVSLATAAMGQTAYRSAIKSLSEDISGLVTKTRINAMTTGTTVTLCPVTDISAESPDCVDWTELAVGSADNDLGWAVFKDYDGNGSFDNGDVLLTTLAFNDYGGKAGVATDSGTSNFISYNRKGELRKGSRTLSLSSNTSKYSGSGFDRDIVLATATGRVRNVLQ